MGEQRTPEWRQRRCGKITGTRAGIVLSGNWTGLVGIMRNEIATGKPEWSDFDCASMAHGRATEPRGLSMMELVIGEDIERVEFVDHPEIDYIGVSPDGLTPQYLVELKCPYSIEVHDATLRHGMPKKHQPQVQHGAWVCGRPQILFGSYCPHYPDPDKTLFIEIIDRDDAYIAHLAERCAEFMAVVRGEAEAPSLTPRSADELFAAINF